MGFKVQKKTIELLYKLIDGKSEVTSVVNYEPQKMLYETEIESTGRLSRSIPEEEGISSEYLCRFLQEVQSHPKINLHGIMVLRNGHVVAEGAVHPYKKEMWHATYSLCKSITGLAIGMLIDEKKLKLTDRVIDILGSYTNSLTALRHKSLTVRHLLTMSSGAGFNEAGAVAANEWVRGYFESSNRFSHGSQFAYNSMNSYMLSAIVSKVAGMNMMEYLKPRLWEPLEISQVYWELSPEKIIKGGWGLFLRIEDMAKIGQMMLQKGAWNGKQIVSEEWAEEAVKKQIDTGENNGYAYGYHNWVSETEHAFLFNGMLGQNMIAYPDKNIVVVTTAGNNELFVICPLVELIRKYFGGEFIPQKKLEPNLSAYKQLLKCQTNLGKRNMTGTDLRQRGWKQKNPVRKRFGRLVPARKIPLKENIWKSCGHFVGKVYEMDSKRGILLPIFLQMVHNNYSKGIQRLAFDSDEDGFFMEVTEGDCIYKIYIGFGRACYQVLYYNGEPYWIAVRGEFAQNEDGVEVLKLELPFIETPHTRMIKIFRYSEHVEIVLDEVPGVHLIKDGLESVLPMDKTNFLQDLLNKLDLEYFHYKLQGAIEAKIMGTVIHEIKEERADIPREDLVEMQKVQQIISDPRFEEEYRKTAEYEKERIYCGHDQEHLERTAEIGYSIIQKKQLPISKSVMYAAAYLHDIGRARQYEGGRKHAESGAEIAAEILKDCGYSEGEIAAITDAIRKHEQFQEEEDSLAWVLYRADKASRPCYDCAAFDSCKWSEELKNKEAWSF